jgi:hypothetical protein
LITWVVWVQRRIVLDKGHDDLGELRGEMRLDLAARLMTMPSPCLSASGMAGHMV